MRLFAFSLLCAVLFAPVAARADDASGAHRTVSLSKSATLLCWFRCVQRQRRRDRMDFLRHFDWTIDYPDQKFVLTANSLQ